MGTNTSTEHPHVS